MISEGFLKAERPLAQHSTSLAARVPQPDELAAMLAAAAPRLRLALAESLRPLLGGEKAQVECSKVEKIAAPRLHKMIDPVAVNLLLEDAGGAQMLASLDYAGALVLTDQVFGGRGDAPGVLPDRLPAATDLTMARLAAALGEALAGALERPQPLRLAARSEVLGKLVRARDDDMFLALRCEVALPGRNPWAVQLVMRLSQAALLLVEGARAPRPVDAAADVPVQSLDAPFADLPLELVAVLAEMSVPVSRISALRPGDTIPLAIPANIPLYLDRVAIAHGQAGSADGVLALRLTRLTHSQTEGHTHDR
ncbi:FliM/FliN family flagellar motor switch protein [Alteraurantiacibacter palmitatis]|uniref:FliM/FliN family flagellar motor C-terminal domain-containing protein n=1 Tax=Alteraurantiacibacter palmitatis TaxID=2054628 RepID=A0ABV7EBG4_9SPHN